PSAARMAAESGWRRSITSSPRCWSGHTSRAAICEARPIAIASSSPAFREGGNAMPGKVGFIGLGNMGGPMALNLAKGGFELVVHDIDPKKLDPLVAAGAAIETSPAAVA